jgi:cell division protein ZapA
LVIVNRPAVDLRVGGQSYRVVTTSDPSALQRYAQLVDERLRNITAGGAVHPNGLVLVALSLVHELEEERSLRQRGEDSARETLRSMLARIDAALDAVDENGDPLPPAPPERPSP